VRIPGQHSREPALQGEAMTPLIDVVFLLLVFFVCASVGQLPDELLPAVLGEGSTETQLEPPPPAFDEPEHQDVIVGLRVGSQPGSLQMQLNEVTIPTADELRSRLVRLSEIDPLTRIILDIDDDVTVQQFVHIYDLCQALPFQSVLFGVRN